jgi:tungstate transport system substrate-binding protein
MNKKFSLYKLLGLVALAAVLLAACAPAATPTAVPTNPPAATDVATIAPTVAVATKAPDKPTATAFVEPTLAGNPGELTLATTTSTQDSGLLDYLLPMFEKQFNVKVKVIAVGSGQALQLGKDGNADVLLVHSPAAEKEFMANKDGTRREDVMYNDFVLVGPASDPAKIGSIKTAAEAFAAIANAKATFISRGDNSGTYTKEKGIWTTAKIDPKGDWYVSAGQGMGAVLTMADEKQAYTLSDRATYMTQVQKGLTLKILVQGEKGLLNPYGVIAVDPAKSPKIQADLATKFIDWIISVPTQEQIAAFKKADFGISLFIPSSKPWTDAHPVATPAASAASGAGGLKITGKVATEASYKDDEVKAMTTIKVQAANKDGVMTDYTGVPIKALLEAAKPAAAAATLVFVASDGYKVEMPLKDAQGCDQCIVSFGNQGGFNTVLPTFAKNLQVKGVVELQVK